MRQLTAKYVLNAKPGRHCDGNGLYLLVGETGCRSWILRVMVNGRRRDIGLGGLQRHILIQPSSVGDDIPIEERSHLTLAEARELAVRIRNVAKAGRDPTAVRKRPARIEQKSTPTFEAAAIAAHGAQSHGWSDRSSKAFLARLEEHAYPKLGKMPVDTIHADDVAEALKPIWVAKPATAKKVRQHIATVLDYAAAKRWREYGAPREQVRALTGKPKSSGRNYPSMPYEKVPLYWRDLSGAGETVGRLALMFLIATGARSIEVREAQWRHIDRKKAEWERPAELMRKSDQKHIVTLNKPALDILARAAAYSASHDPDALIFANRKGTTLSDMTISKIMRDDDMPWVPHGFRSSLRTWAAEQQPFIPEPVAEAALSHVIPDAVIKAYNRASFLEMRRMLLDEWGAFITGDEWKAVQPRPLL
ncbi:MAG: integrase arm-type DNA-binding domain-containing protein [Alphaproteobacteria bacterium]|nr:integrase arm-type DNA-binding domain-containing protein [Alphaproteobacteria bacterium]MBU0865983.1 integrase arm-type DNA-binding domain-containing protein [Alphaproteobacteria bacterium]MBU1824815.1 integrase arm-type DNA-binding domain-containing protein [Alphaproteobacteria bacterium]